MDAATRTLVWDRARGYCEYCRIHQDHVEHRHQTHVNTLSESGNIAVFGQARTARSRVRTIS